MLNTFCSPSRYIQGRDATFRLPEEMRKMGLSGKTLIIASPTARKELEGIWLETFPMHQSSFEVVTFGGECSVDEIARCRNEAIRSGAVSIVGVGGGKVLDSARAVAHELSIPVVTCPTVAASDAPCSAVSVVYSRDGVFEEVRTFPKNPALVLVDSSVIARAPVRFLVAGMGDALATWFEADTASRAHKGNVVGGTPTLAALAIANLCYQTLLADGKAAIQAVKRQSVTPALERIIEANTLLSGLGFESGGLAVAHSVHNGLTAARETHDYLHGEKVAFGTIVQLVFEGRDSGLIEEVLGFCLSVGLPVTLKDLGIETLSMDRARAIADLAVAPGESAHNEPFPVTWQGIRDAILVADAWGQDFRRAQSAMS
jgi:glycerol dehydrogenase